MLSSKSINILMIVLNNYFKSSVIMSGWVIARDEVCSSRPTSMKELLYTSKTITVLFKCFVLVL